MKVIKRLFKLDLPANKSAFLWGPRKVGKSYWIKQHLKDTITIDLLMTDIFADYISRPALLRERYAGATQQIVIDEVQKVPALLDEVHWLIENHQQTFLLTGSSPRKLKRNHANLLGGRAWRYTMTPLCTPEIENLDIKKAIISGFIPSHLLADDPLPELRAYVADYLKEEIAAEALVRNIPAFSEFLRVAAQTNGELLNYNNVAREVGVAAKVVREYFQILEDTLLGFRLSPWKKATNRRLIETEKFYLFDVGVANYLARRKPAYKTPEFGKSFEHFILMELKAYQAYVNPELPLYYWRTASGQEVDFILGDMDIALEVKSSEKVTTHDTRGLKALQQEHSPRKALIISFEKEFKQLEANIECHYWQDFLTKLWAGDLGLS